MLQAVWIKFSKQWWKNSTGTQLKATLPIAHWVKQKNNFHNLNSIVGLENHAEIASLPLNIIVSLSELEREMEFTNIQGGLF